MKRSISAALFAAILLVALPATAATAESDAPETLVINGQEYGPAEGLTFETGSIPVDSEGNAGAWFPTDTAPGTITPMTTWGASYAFSQERLYIDYTGYGKAAANVYNGERIIQVCFWWTRSGSAVSNTYCSNASFNSGAWYAGSETVGSTYDSLGLHDPQTIFNYRLGKIDPSIRY